jgi:hypothetical protein
VVCVCVSMAVCVCAVMRSKREEEEGEREGVVGAVGDTLGVALRPKTAGAAAANSLESQTSAGGRGGGAAWEQRPTSAMSRAQTPAAGGRRTQLPTSAMSRPKTAAAAACHFQTSGGGGGVGGGRGGGGGGWEQRPSTATSRALPEGSSGKLSLCKLAR